MSDYILTGKDILAQLKEVSRKATKADRIQLDWGASLIQAKIDEAEKLKAESLSKNLGQSQNSYAEAVVNASNYSEAKRVVIEKFVKPIIKESYVWQDFQIIYTYVLILKTGVSLGLSRKGGEFLAGSFLESCADWAEKSADWLTLKGESELASYHSEFANAVRLIL